MNMLALLAFGSGIERRIGGPEPGGEQHQKHSQEGLFHAFENLSFFTTPAPSFTVTS